MWRSVVRGNALNVAWNNPLPIGHVVNATIPFLKLPDWERKLLREAQRVREGRAVSQAVQEVLVDRKVVVLNRNHYFAPGFEFYYFLEEIRYGL
jgi:hypothetical protein